MALQGVLANNDEQAMTPVGADWPKWLASLSYKYADAMLAERGRQ
jgi:hypothetical protein